VKQSFWLRLDLFARSLFPCLVTLGFVLLGSAPLRVPELSAVMPALSLIAVYHFTIHHPRLLPYWATFLIGILQDLISGIPPGVSVIVLLTVQAVIRARYRYFATAGFSLNWCNFLLLSAAAFMIGWLLTSIGFMRVLDPRPAVFQYLLTGAVYPVLAWLIMRVRKTFREENL
jgi:rod shape-determining protein MreD